MNLFAMCINVIAQPEVIELYKNQLSFIPIKLKTVLLKILCKRGLIKDSSVLKQLVHSNIIEVDLSECDVTNDMLSCLVECKSLQKLDLSLRRRQTRCITTEVLASLFENFPHLKVLAIPQCQELNDEVIKAICKNCIKLRELHIPYSSITDLSLSLIGENLFQLSVINILGAQISDEGICCLINGPLGKNLNEINIDKCPNVSSNSTAIVAKKCNNIKIFSCGSIGDNVELVLPITGIKTRPKQVFWNI